MRTILTALILLPSSALAHIGHLGDVAGHGHWIALGGIAIAAGIAGAIALHDARKKPTKDAAEASEDHPDTDDDTQEAPV